MVVEFCLPERTFRAIFVRNRAALFEGRDKTKQVGLGRVALGEEMQMIGHEAEGVEQERVARRERNQVTQCHVAERDVSEMCVAVVRTDCDEIDSIPEVVPRSKADILPVE